MYDSTRENNFLNSLKLSHLLSVPGRSIALSTGLQVCTTTPSCPQYSIGFMELGIELWALLTLGKCSHHSHKCVTPQSCMI